MSEVGWELAKWQSLVVVINGTESSRRTITNGVPPGLVLVLFNIFIMIWIKG